MTTPARPPLDPALATIVEMVPALSAPLTLEGIAASRATSFDPPIDDLLSGRGLVRSDHTVQTADGGQILVSVIARAEHGDPSAPGVLWIHGGGMVAGDRHSGVALPLQWVEEHDAVLASVEYRLAPEHPDPIPVEDCYTALCWFSAHAEDLGFDPERLLLAGGSAGGGLAAGVALLARDRRGPQIAWQLLQCPMLDDRDRTVSSHQFVDGGPWPRRSNQTGWRALLGDRVGGPEVSHYAAPARAADLTGLPPTFIDVGDAEVFRDEAVEYASRLWRAGVNCELHVWPGGFHGFSNVPGVPVAESATRAIHDWVRRRLQPPLDLSAQLFAASSSPVGPELES
ncbi:alpha/beta hydrolase [Microbacterium sp. JZ70]|uniref:alpha/beta hydrolase n=1 Tax=Microbacterium sp. JZ37 TaxID=2654193 RepID=UPI002B480FA2|nr:alpha/beta hydrolase [Microbacterium sp. JZ37]